MHCDPARLHPLWRVLAGVLGLFFAVGTILFSFGELQSLASGHHLEWSFFPPIIGCFGIGALFTRAAITGSNIDWIDVDQDD